MTDLDRLAAHFRTLAADHRRDAEVVGRSSEFHVESNVASHAFLEAATACERVAEGHSLSTELAALRTPYSGAPPKRACAPQERESAHQAREHSVPCSHCGHETWATDGICDNCAGREPEPLFDTRAEDRGER